MGHAAIIKYDMLADSVRFQVGKIFGRGSTSCRTWNVGVNSSVKRRNAASRSSARSSSRMEEASWHDIRSDILCDLCILMHTYATCFNILQVSSRSCPIFGVEDMDVVSYCIMLLTSCYIILIVDNIDSDPCQIILIHVACAVAVKSRKDGREQGHQGQVAPGIPGERGDTRGIDPQLGFGSLVAFRWIEPGLDMTHWRLWPSCPSK